MRHVSWLFLAGASCALAYIPNPIDGPPLHRPDYGNIVFLANQNIAAGMQNNDGKTWITADSAPIDAVNGAIAAWAGVSTSAIHFAPLQSTNLSYQAADGNNVIVFADDLNTRSLTPGAVAFTVATYNTATPGVIKDTDIYFSPLFTFSTTQAAGTYDLQAVLTHELGHSLGANHTNILSATMYFATAAQDTHQQSLSADDIAFVSTLYPVPGGNGYGTITGTTSVSGTPLLGGMITAVDPVTGVTIGGISSVSDGSYSLSAPPGNYYVYVEPAVNISLYQNSPNNIVTTSFQATFAGGIDNPSTLHVQTGTTVSADINAPAGTSIIKVPFSAIAGAGLTGDYRGSVSSRSLPVSSGQSVDYLFSDPLAGPITESNIRILGPAILRPGSLRVDPNISLSGTPVYRFTLDIPPATANTSATIVFTSGSDILTRTGALILTRPQSVNAASFRGGPVAPGEILSFFGSQLGPASATSNGGFDDSGLLPVSLGNIAVSFDKTQAPLFYVSSSQINLQVPYEITGQSSTAMTVSYNGNVVATSTLTVASSAPGIFVVTNANGSVNGPGAPASVGGVLVIYGTGTGVTSGTLHTGAAAPANSTVPAVVTIGGRSAVPSFSGLTPGSVGLAQVNVAIPPGTPPGDSVPLVFSINGAATQTVDISVR